MKKPSLHPPLRRTVRDQKTQRRGMWGVLTRLSGEILFLCGAGKPIMRYILLIFFFLMAVRSSGSEITERFPPPEFTVPYTQPESVLPSGIPENAFFTGVVFTSMLILATLSVFLVRKRWAIYVVMVLSLILFGMVRHGCICPVGGTQNIVLGIADSSYAVPWLVVFFFTLPLLLSLIFGRVFCSGVCPLGGIQELLALRPIKVPYFLDQGLGIMAYVFLGVVVFFVSTGLGFPACRWDPYVIFFRGWGPGISWLLAVIFFLLGIYVARPYCRYLCPYGALLRLCSSLSYFQIRTSPDTCENCNLCQDSCPYGAIERPSDELSHKELLSGRYFLAFLFFITPFLLVFGAVQGWMLGDALSVNHPVLRQCQYLLDVRKAQALEETSSEGEVSSEKETFPEKEVSSEKERSSPDKYPGLAVEALEGQGITPEMLFSSCIQVQERCARGGMWLGLWCMLVFSVKMIQLTMRRKRTSYQIDTSRCVCCGRCFSYCPNSYRGYGRMSEEACERKTEKM